MADETTTTTTTQAPVARPESNGVDTTKTLLEKINALQGELSGERAKVKALETERDGYKTKNEGFEREKSRSKMFKDAVSKHVGKDFTIDQDALTNVEAAVLQLGDSESLSSIVENLVIAARRPIKGTAPTMPFSGAPAATTGTGSQSVPEKKPTEYTMSELRQIHAEDPQKCEKIMEARVAAAKQQGRAG